MAGETDGQGTTVPAASTLAQAEPKHDTNPVTRSGSTPNLRFQVPAFYTDDPDLWFFQLEAMFTVNRITSEQDKYAVIVANLPYTVVRRIPRTLVETSTPYSTLKELVVKETDLSDYQRSEKLHALPALGDQRPSDLLASIRNLQPVQDCGCYCSRFQFLSRMPPITRAQLVNRKELTVDELAELADTIMLSQASVQSVLAEVDADRHNAEVLALRPRPTASPTKEKKKKADLCWFHSKWGKEAKSCRSPCSWS